MRRLTGYWGLIGEGTIGPTGRQSSLERVAGIEPARSAWEADRLPLHHTRDEAVVAEPRSDRQQVRRTSASCILGLLVRLPT